MFDSLSFIITIIRSYWMMFLSFLGGVALFKQPPPPIDTRLFNHSNETIHWMEISNTERYGTQLKHQWCDQDISDDISHYREFFSPKTAGSYFPNGEKKWFIGHHWRDFIHGGGLYFYNILMRRSIPAVYAYDLNSPSNTGMRAAYRKVCEQMNPIEQPKKAKERFFKFSFTGLDMVMVVIVVLAMTGTWRMTAPLRADWSTYPNNPVAQQVQHPQALYTEQTQQPKPLSPALQQPNNTADIERVLAVMNGIAEQQAATNQQLQVIIVKQRQQEVSINKLNRDRIRRNRR
jgi:hypothetical protein